MGLDLTFDLPVYLVKDGDYYKNLEEKFEEYKKKINSVKPRDLITDECVKNISKNCETILTSIMRHYDGELVRAEQNIEQCLSQYCNSPFITAPIKQNYAFRGVAPVNLRPNIYARGKECSQYVEMMKADQYFFRGRVSAEHLGRDDMRHIPFDNRGIISTQRFSIYGTPCLYFATTTYGTWLELEMPDFHSFQVSAYDIPQDLKILNLCINTGLINGASSYTDKDGTGKKFASDFLEIYPFVIASSYVVSDPNRVFKSEYIISQLIMQAARNLGMDGVAYLSKKLDDKWTYPCCVNLALFMPCAGNAEIKYWERISDIRATEPCTIYDLQSHASKGDKNTYKSYINKIYCDDNNYSTVKIAGNSIKYTETIFSDFDEFLWARDKVKFKNN